MKNTVIILCFCLFSSCFNSSNELNKSLPIVLDKITTLKTTASIGKKIIYFYEIKDQNLNNLPKKDLELMMLNIKEYAMNGFKWSGV